MHLSPKCRASPTKSIEPVESVAKNANTREMLKACDEVIVTSGGQFLGVVTVQKMLTTLAQVQRSRWPRAPTP